MRIRHLGFMCLAISLFALAPFGALTAAESACKGLQNGPCKQNETCSWVQSYKLKNGKDVSGFCRKKASRKQSEPKKAS